MKINKEIRAGFWGIISIALLLIGANWMKKKYYLNSTFTLTAEFNSIKGLLINQTVNIRGYELGHVTKIYKKENSEKIYVDINMYPNTRVPKNAVAVLQGSLVRFSPPQIYLKFGGSCADPSCFLEDGAMIKGRNTELQDWINPSLLARADPILQKLGNVDSVYRMLDEWMATSERADDELKSLDKAVNLTLGNASKTTKEVQARGERLTKLIQVIDKTIVDLQKQAGGKIMNSISFSLDSIKKAISSADTQIESINAILNQANLQVEQLRKNPRFQMLVDDRSIPEKLAEQIEKLHCTLIDFRENPSRYLKLGKKNKFNQIQACN